MVEHPYLQSLSSCAALLMVHFPLWAGLRGVLEAPIMPRLLPRAQPCSVYRRSAVACLIISYFNLTRPFVPNMRLAAVPTGATPVTPGLARALHGPPLAARPPGPRHRVQRRLSVRPRTGELEGASSAGQPYTALQKRARWAPQGCQSGWLKQTNLPLQAEPRCRR